MAQNISEITATMVEDVQANADINQQLTSTSKSSVWRSVLFICAKAVWSLQIMFDLFKSEIEIEMAKQKIHSKQWYRQKALDFQHGFALVPGTDQYNNINYTDDQITASKVVKQAACIKLISANGYGILRVKVAGDDGNGNLTQLPNSQFEAVKQYFTRYVADAGTQLKITTGEADDLLLNLDIYYDPLVLSTTGTRLDGTSETPVKDAIISFLKSLEFNGALYIDDLTNKIRTVDGVRLVKCLEARSKYGSYDYWTDDIQNIGLIDEIRVADAGYMKLDLDQLQVNYKVMPE